jgi:GDPmannose 4,6-dehydratase
MSKRNSVPPSPVGIVQATCTQYAQVAYDIQLSENFSSTMSRVLITGVSGQDGAYLSEFLLGQGHIVYGTYRRTSSVNLWRLQELGVAEHPSLHLVEFDLTDLGTCISLVQRVQPDFIFNLAAQSFVAVSFEQPSTTAHITGIGALNLLEAVRLIDPKIKFYQASTSEMFGKVQAVPQREDTPFWPRSPYGVAKLYAHWMTVNYRESYGIFGASGILFNHESPLRGQEFVTRKITDSVAKIACGKQRSLELGNLDAKRDWGYAKEYVEGMWQMLQVSEPDTYVLATGRTETVRDFVRLAFRAIGVDIEFIGTGVDEVGKVAAVTSGATSGLTNPLISGEVVVRVNPKFYRPAEVDLLVGDPSKANDKLGWAPKTKLEDLCAMMVEADLRRNRLGFSF